MKKKIYIEWSTLGGLIVALTVLIGYFAETEDILMNVGVLPYVLIGLIPLASVVSLIVLLVQYHLKMVKRHEND